METVIAALSGGVGIPVVNFLKGKLGWSGKASVALTTAVSVVLGVAAMFITGQLGLPTEFTPEAIAGFVGVVFSTATIVFKLLPKPE